MEFVVIVVYILAFFGGFLLYFKWGWVILAISFGGIALIATQSTFFFIQTGNQILFKKEFLGLPIIKRSFTFQCVSVSRGQILFEGGEEEVAIYYERESLDALELEIAGKFYDFGTEKEAERNMRELRQFFG